MRGLWHWAKTPRSVSALAAPLIAIACTVLVIDLAQLNIGFARSRNEIVVVEMQSAYPRVHVARYTALYTSLATRYEFHLDDPAGQVLPFPGGDSPQQFAMSWGQTYGELVCRRGDDTHLTGFSVASNATDYMHSEEMADFGGAVTLQRNGVVLPVLGWKVALDPGVWQVVNGTTHPLDDCRVIRGGESGSIELATIGRLDPGATAPLKFGPYARRGGAAADHAQDALEGPSHESPQGPDPTGELGVEAVAEVAIEKLELRAGETCLLARIVDEVHGLTVTPAAGPMRQAALLVAHLDAGPFPEPRADRKLTAPPTDAPEIQMGQRRRRATLPQTPNPQTPSPGPEDPFSDDRTH